MNVYDKAHELARALAQSNEYKAFVRARDAVERDAKNKDILKDFKNKQYKLQLAQMSGNKPSDEEIQNLQKLYEILSYNTEINNFLQAEMTFSRMLADVYKIIGEAVDIDLDFLTEKDK